VEFPDNHVLPLPAPPFTGTIMPNAIDSTSAWRPQFHHVIDIVPTILEVVGRVTLESEALLVRQTQVQFDDTFGLCRPRLFDSRMTLSTAVRSGPRESSEVTQLPPATSRARLREISMHPSAPGLLSRLAFIRAMSAGMDVSPLMVKAAVTRRQVEDESVRLAVKGQIKFVELIADALHDDVLGFHLACDYDIREIGLLYYVWNSSKLLGDAFYRAERYSSIVNEAVCLRVRGNGNELALTYVGVKRISDRHQMEFWITSLVRICRQLTNRHLLPSCVRFVHSRNDGAAALEKFLGCNVEFGARADEVVFPEGVKQLPVVCADPHLNELLIKYCDEARSYRKTGRLTWRVAVENAIAPLLPHGKAGVGEIARQLGMSPRTLERRLGSEGLTFGLVLSELRCDLAKRYLREKDLPISKIAWLLGYQESGGFTHAFKRWTGRTPREARADENVARLDDVPRPRARFSASR
jgi:AraC-like DNA-binding protein